MTKLRPTDFRRDEPGPRSGGVRGRLIALALAAGLLLPLVRESAALCAASWRGMLGQVERVETPALDWTKAQVERGVRSVRREIHGLFIDLPWEPGVIIAIGIGWALFMSVPLKRTS